MSFNPIHNEWQIIHQEIFKDKDACLLPRDQLSVPNFATLQEREDDDDVINEELEDAACFIPAGNYKAVPNRLKAVLYMFHFRSLHISFYRKSLQSSDNVLATLYGCQILALACFRTEVNSRS